MDELSGLPESVRKLAMDRFRLLQPHLEQNRPLDQVALEAGIPYRTAQRWLTRYQQFGLAALARKRRADRGVRRAVSAGIREAIEGLALQKPPLPISALYRQMLQAARGLGEKAPCYGVVYGIVRDLPADLVTLAHEGTKTYSEAFDLVHRREASGPNAIWQADHSPLDILLVRPDHEPTKPWLTIVLDERTKAGLETARREGRIGGRRPKLTSQQQAEIIRTVSRGSKTAADAARLFSVHPATISRLLARARASQGLRYDKNLTRVHPKFPKRH